MMTNFEFVQQIFEWGMDIKNYVKFGSITADQYKEITGVDYAA